MKVLWKNARDMQESSGWGVKPEDNDAKINEILERKCICYWRLDSIWGTRPNATVVVNMDSTAMPTATPQQPSLTAPSTAYSTAFPRALLEYRMILYMLVNPWPLHMLR